MPDEQPETSDGGELSEGCTRIRMGHAFRSKPGATDLDDVSEVLGILRGELTLEPREPAEPNIVSLAEQLLGLRQRPIYTFSGCLHPKLGIIGLVIAPGCLGRCLQGVSRCDSGGLAARYGAFEYIGADDVGQVLLSLSFDCDPAWLAAFSDEVARSYDTHRCYVTGDAPRLGSWGDVRAQCFLRYEAEHGEIADRRLWTWEVRLAQAPDASAYEGLVLSHEAFKRFDQLRREGKEVPDGVRVVRGNVGPTGVHYFNEVAVIDMLCGAHVP